MDNYAKINSQTTCNSLDKAVFEYLTPQNVGLNQDFPASADTSTATQVAHTHITENLTTKTIMINVIDKIMSSQN